MGHVGGSMGFIPNNLLILKSGSKTGDYHSDMNGENYEKQVKNKLIPNLPEHSIVVTDNAPYHNLQINAAPTTNLKLKKAEMISWLENKQIPLSPNLLKIQFSMILSKNTKNLH